MGRRAPGARAAAAVGPLSGDLAICAVVAGSWAAPAAATSSVVGTHATATHRQPGVIVDAAARGCRSESLLVALPGDQAGEQVDDLLLPGDDLVEAAAHFGEPGAHLSRAGVG